MGGRKRDAQFVRHQHHHREGCAESRGKVFGMAGKRDAGVIDYAFLDRRRYHRGKFSGATTVYCPIDQPQYLQRIARIELARRGRHRKRQM
jgi:hypothetical protein